MDQLEDPPPASGIEDCGPFKKVWSYRYLCYNLGKEILCLLCFCRFTQFKKFNLDRHMRNKHPHLYHVDDETKKRVLDLVRTFRLLHSNNSSRKRSNSTVNSNKIFVEQTDNQP